MDGFLFCLFLLFLLFVREENLFLLTDLFLFVWRVMLLCLKAFAFVSFFSSLSEGGGFIL